MTEIILIVILLVVATLAFLVFRQPDTFHVTRERQIKAPAASIFPYVNDLEKWQAWSPWARMEPDANTRFEGPKAGEGAVFHWQGRKTGAGSMTILETRPGTFVRMQLDFLKPMKATNTTELTLTEEGKGTRVSWTMYGPTKIAGKVINLFINCDKMCGSQFEDGLANLAEIAEK